MYIRFLKLQNQFLISRKSVVFTQTHASTHVRAGTHAGAHTDTYLLLLLLFFFISGFLSDLNLLYIYIGGCSIPFYLLWYKNWTIRVNFICNRLIIYWTCFTSLCAWGWICVRACVWGWIFNHYTYWRKIRRQCPCKYLKCHQHKK